MSIEFATTNELIAELLNRTTFVGIIIHSMDENRDPDMFHKSFQISTTLSSENLSKLLSHVTHFVESTQD